MTIQQKKQKKGLIRFLLTVLALVGLAILAVPFLLVPPAVLDIQLSDNVFDTDLNGKIANITDESGYTREIPIYKDSNRFIAHVGRVYSGESKWMVEMDGFQSAHFSVDIQPLSHKIARVKLKPKGGRIKIQAMNAVKPDIPVHTALTVTVGNKKHTGEAGEGLAVVAVDPGKHEIKIEAEDYYAFSTSVSVDVGTEKELIVYLSPRLTGSETARIVLRWGREPRDLDSHLLLPYKANVKHVYYPDNNKRAMVNGQLAAMLDVDDTTSFGPETITLYDKMNGRFTYGVYLYTGSGTMGTSGATVEVYTRAADIKKFQVPEYCQKRWWYVFDLEVTGTDVRVVSKNECKDKMNMMPGKK